MIDFRKLTIKNFLSIGKEPIIIEFTNGLNVIMGINKDKHDRSNGSGKSSVMDALYFALLGKTIRGLKKSSIVNKKTKKESEVTLEFEQDGVKYEIIRGVKPSVLVLKKNGKDVSRDSIINTQSHIDTIIGVSEDVIKNCVIMGINQTVPFMEQTKVEKRKFIEGIFDMSIFSEMLKEARSDYNDNTKKLTSLTSKTEEQKKSYKIYVEQSEKFEESKKNRIIDEKTKIKSLQKTKKQYESKLIKVDVNRIHKIDEQRGILDGKIDEIGKKIDEGIFPKLDEAKTDLTNVKSDIRHTQKSIDDAFISGKCPTCHREMSKDDTSHVESEINKKKDQIKQFELSKNDIECRLDKINEAKQAASDKIQEYRNTINDLIREKEIISEKIRKQDRLKDQINDIDNQISNHKQNIEKISDETNELDKTIRESKNAIDKNEIDIEDTSELIDILDQIKFILGENGVKSYIINKMLKLFNKRINYYLNKLNANCILTFDEFFEETIINETKHECSYFNFSSGERRNIDISIMFAFMDIQKLQGRFDTNIMMFDELLDGCLDEDGVEYILDILNEKSNNGEKSVYIISHRKEAAKFATGEVINIEKQNGISKRI